MRILFDDLVLSSTISMLHQNTNYAVNNIKHQFVKKIAMSTAISDTFTFAFPTAKRIDCCFLAFTNAQVATLQSYNSSDILLATNTINVTTMGGNFTAVENVKYCKLTLGGTENVYIGKVSIGDSYTMPDPLADIQKGFKDNSNVFLSDDGQVSINKVEWLRTIKPSFFTDDIDIYNEIYALFSAVEKPVWINCFENTLNVINPLYGYVEFSSDGREDKLYTFSFVATEAR